MKGARLKIEISRDILIAYPKQPRCHYSCRPWYSSLSHILAKERALEFVALERSDPMGSLVTMLNVTNKSMV